MAATTNLNVSKPDPAWRGASLRVSIVKAVGRRMVSCLIEATLIPTASVKGG